MDPWLTVLLGLTAVVIVLSAYATRDRLWSDEEPPAPPDHEDDDTPEAREREVREHVRARNERRAARGVAPLAEEAEVWRLLGTPDTGDEELRAEARVLVERANERRAASGRPPLPVEAEIDRRLRELEGDP